jgi:hypothetical protein
MRPADPVAVRHGTVVRVFPGPGSGFVRTHDGVEVLCQTKGMDATRPGLERALAEQLALVRIDTSLPARRLLFAVLEDAVHLFQTHATASRPHGRRLFVETERWIASDDTSWPFAFVRVCHELGLDAASLRAGLWRWRDRQRERGTPADEVTPPASESSCSRRAS